MGDIKSYLRKMDFPQVVPETLGHMQKFWNENGQTQQLVLMKELSQEFVFFEVDQWGQDKPKISSIKELAIIQQFLFFFEKEGPDAKLSTFIFLFPHGSTILKKRLLFFNKLISIAIAVRHCNILTYVGVWMQLNGCSSNNSQYLAEFVCNEHFKAKRELSAVMKELPLVSPLFCASITASLATLYLDDCPLKRLVEIIQSWLNMAPLFAFEPLKMRIPTSFNFSGPQTPLPDLMHWAILSPFYKLKPEENSSKDMFSLLHRDLLKVMLHASKLEGVFTWQSIPIKRIRIIVDSLSSLASPHPEDMGISLGRLAQCLEIGLANQCIQPDDELGDLFITCINLPYHQLLKAVLQKWSHKLDAIRNRPN